MNELLKQLTESQGVSSHENEVRSLILDLIVDDIDDWHVDAMGNLIAQKKGVGKSDLRVLIDAHMDEVGLMISGVDRDGTCKFMAVGGVNPRSLLGKVVQIGPKKITGVIGARPIHLLDSNQRGSVVKTESMRIDIGAKSKEEANRKIKPGDMASFVTKYEEFGNIAIGKAFDNRVGCAALVELLKLDPYPFHLVATFTVQEEVGLRGAKVAAYSTNPSIALILESTPAYDLPNKRDESPNVSLGKGPSIYVMDRGTIQDPRIVAHLTKTATSREIPFQIRQPGGGGTNTSAIQQTGAGVPAATLATPTRYIHTPVSMIDLTDFYHVVALADASLRTINLEQLQYD